MARKGQYQGKRKGRRKWEVLPALQPQDQEEFPVGARVWYPNGIAGWKPAVVTGYTRVFIVIQFEGGWRNNGKGRAQPHKLRHRVTHLQPQEKAY